MLAKPLSRIIMQTISHFRDKENRTLRTRRILYLPMIIKQEHICSWQLFTTKSLLDSLLLALPHVPTPFVKKTTI